MARPKQRIVMKFGGTSMAGIERIRHVAGLVKREADRGNEVAVVVSALAGGTGRRLAMWKESAPPSYSREDDAGGAPRGQGPAGPLAVTRLGHGPHAPSS